MLRACLILAAMLGCLALVTHAQPDKKAEPSKTKDADKGKKEPAKSKNEESKEPIKAKTPLDNTKNNGTVVVVDDLLDAMAMFPKFWLLSLDKYQELQDKIKALEKQLKVEEVLPSFCKLQAKADGDYLAIKADFVFATEQPRSALFVGMLNAHLMGPGTLDGKPANTEAIDKRGFLVRVDKEGSHQLTMNFVVRIKSSAGGTERGVELGLPGAAGGSLQIDLPPTVKEFRSNDELEKPKSPGKWVVPIGKSKLLKLAWKEPITQTGNAPLYEVDSQVQVRIDETHAHIKGDLNIHVLRPTKEWRVLLPPGATAQAIAPNDDKYPLQPPQSDQPYHLFKAPPVGGERWRIAVTMSLPRPNVGVRLPIGPFAVLGAATQRTSLTVQMPTEASAGQRLVFHRPIGVSQIKNTETEASFVAIPDAKSVGAPPLELEWRYDKTQLETQVKHALKWKTQPWGWQLDVETRIDLKTVFASATAVDLRLPLPRQRGVLLSGTVMPGVAFPGSMPWGGLWADPLTDDVAIVDDVGNLLKSTPQDAFGRTRVSWGSPAKKMVLILKSSYRVGRAERRMKLELARAINTQDRGARLTVQGDDGIELLYGPLGAEEAVPERHRFSLSQEQSPARIDLAWRPHRREIAATSTVDITIHQHNAEIQQTIHFPWDAGASEDDPTRTHARLLVPAEIEKLSVLSDGDASRDRASGTLAYQPRVRAGERVEVALQYDVPLDRKEGAGTLKVPLVWPASASRRDVKVRVWSQVGGCKVRVTDDLIERGIWKERSIESVPARDHYPMLVLQASGTRLPLALKIEQATLTQTAPFLAERGLIQVVMNEDGSQQVRARFLVRKFNTDRLEIELPGRFRDGPVFSWLGKQLDDWEDVGDRVRVRINPELANGPGVLEVQYTIPAEALEHNTRWRTTLETPLFRIPPAIGNLRWQLRLPAPMIAATLGQQARTNTRWVLQGWLLTPELNGPDLEAWIAGKDGPLQPAPMTFAFAQPQLRPVVVYHLPRSWWLMSCSGLLLIVLLGLYLSPVPRYVLSLFLLVLAVGLMVLAFASPALLPAVLFGGQPGVVLLVIFVGAHWLWQERQRQRMLVLPAFSRTKPTSTVTMPAAKRSREPSTVDAPPAPDGGPPSPTASS